MANKFNITITATDRATAVVRKFKDHIAQITRPVRQQWTSFKKLGKELGLDKVGRAFTSVAKLAGTATSKIFSMGGALAGIGIATSIAAIAALTRQWADLGNRIGLTSAITAVVPARLQTLSGAARLFGLSADDMSGALQNVGQSFQDAMFGRNQGALMMINRLNLKVHRLKDGSVDAADALLQISAAVQRQRGVQAQSQITDAFGLTALLPLLQKGPAYIKALEDQWRKTNAVMDPGALDASGALYKKIVLLGGGVEGLSNSLLTRLGPSLGRSIDRMTNFTEKLSGAITKAKSLTDWMKVLVSIGTVLDPVHDAVALWRAFNAPAAPPPAPRRPTRPPPKNTPAYDDWVATHPDRRSAFQMPAFDPKARRPPNMDDLLKKYRGNVDDALVDYDAGSDRAAAWRRGGRRPQDLSRQTQTFLKMAHADSSIMDMLRGGARPGQQPPPATAAAPGAKPAEVTVRFANAPPGMRTTQRPGSKPVGVRIDYSLPEVAAP